VSCDELSEEYELYALGVLEEPERSELAAHLDRHCEVCSQAVRRAVSTVSLFSNLAPQVEPPDRLRRRVMASIGVEPRFQWNWMQTWATVAAAVLLGLFWFDHLRRERVRDLAFRDAMEQVKQAETETARVKDVLALLGSPETIVRVSSDGAVQPPQGKVFLNPSRGVLLLASNLPPAPQGKIYEMWVIPDGGKPVPAGLFQTESNGTAVYLRKGGVDVAATAAVAVTLEASSGAPQPTSTPIIVAAVKKG
jgi:anti-sigma-K factor RskA